MKREARNRAARLESTGAKAQPVSEMERGRIIEIDWKHSRFYYRDQNRFLYNFSTTPITAYSAIAIIHSSTIDMSSQFILNTWLE